ncbi:hypothetical protein CHUAL_011845 [Chamberlinius hualienensis]
MQSRLKIDRFIEIVVWVVMYYSVISQSMVLKKEGEIETQPLNIDQIELLEYKVESNNSHTSFQLLRSLFTCKLCNHFNSELCCRHHQLCCRLVHQCPSSEDLNHCQQTCPGGCSDGQICCPRRRKLPCCTFPAATFKIPAANNSLTVENRHPNAYLKPQYENVLLNNFNNNSYGGDDDMENQNENETNSDTVSNSTQTPTEKFDYYVIEDLLIEQTTATNFELEVTINHDEADFEPKPQYDNESTKQQTATDEVKLTTLPTSSISETTQIFETTNLAESNSTSVTSSANWLNTQGSTSRNTFHPIDETTVKQTTGFHSTQDSHIVSYFPQEDDLIVSKYDDSPIVNQSHADFSSIESSWRLDDDQSDYESTSEVFDERFNNNTDIANDNSTVPTTDDY